MKCLMMIQVLVVVGGTMASSGVDQLRETCKKTKDPLECVRYRAMDLVEQAASQPVYEVMEGVELVRNEEDAKVPEDGEPRGLADSLENYIAKHDLRLRVPEALGGGAITLSPRDLDTGRLSLSLTSDDEENQIESRSRRKTRLRKLIVPLLVFVLLKAMTLIPLALGVLGLKAWNALQLSFFSFVTSLALAIFQLCKKVASDGAVPVAAHAAWDPYHYSGRNFFAMQDMPQTMAYGAYAP